MGGNNYNGNWKLGWEIVWDLSKSPFEKFWEIMKNRYNYRDISPRLCGAPLWLACLKYFLKNKKRLKDGKKQPPNMLTTLLPNKGVGVVIKGVLNMLNMELKRLFILGERERCGERKRGEGLSPRRKCPSLIQVQLLRHSYLISPLQSRLFISPSYTSNERRSERWEMSHFTRWGLALGTQNDAFWFPPLHPLP